MKNKVFTKHAAERYMERFPNLDFRLATSQVSRVPKREKHWRNKERRNNCRIYRSWMGVIFVVRDNYVVTVY